MADETAVDAPTGGTESRQATSREAALSTPILLEVQHLVKAFGGLRAVDDCSFTVARGSITGRIGPNGAGKSTAANLITGFLRADAGAILVDASYTAPMTVHR